MDQSVFRHPDIHAAGEACTARSAPVIRKVAEDLVLNPNTVVRAYRELEHEGVVRGVDLQVPSFSAASATTAPAKHQNDRAAAADSGSASVFAKDAFRIRRRIGFVTEDKELYPEVEVRLASAAIWKTVADDRALAFESIAKRYEREAECDVRVTMLSALNTLADTGEEWLDRLLSIPGSATSVPERFYASGLSGHPAGPRHS